MLEIAAKQMAEALAARDIDPSAFLSEGVDAARQVAGEDRARAIDVLQVLERFATDLADQGVPSWSPFRFGVRSIAALAGNDALLFGELIFELGLLVRAMSDKGLEVELCIQQGIASAAAVEDVGELLGPSLRLATRLAHRRLDPREMLRHAVPAFALVVRDDPSQLAAVLDAVESFVLSLQTSGIGPHRPIFMGVAAVGDAAAGEPILFIAHLRELGSLIASLSVAGISPYPVVEHGVVEAFRAALHAEWLLSEILPFASALAAHGRDPLDALVRGIPAIAGLEEPVGLEMLAVVEAAAEAGIDPAPVLHSFVPVVAAAAGSDPETVARLAEDACSLLGVMEAHGARPLLTFDEGIGRLGARATLPLIERVLRIGRPLAESGSDPGPAICHGVVGAVICLEDQPALLDAILDAAESEAIDAIDPWALLEWGTPAIASLEGDEADKLELLKRLDTLVRELDRLNADVRSILLFTVHQPARAMNHDRALVQSLVDRIAGAIAVLDANGIDPGAVMVTAIPRVAETAPHALEHAFRIVDEMAARKIDPAPFLAAALPALASTGSGLEASLQRMMAAVDALGERASRLAEAVEVIARAAGDRTWVVLRALDAIIELGRAVDPTAIAAVVAEVSIEDEETFERLLAVTGRALRRAAPLGPGDGSGLAGAARVSGGRPELLEETLASWQRAGAVLLRAQRAAILEWGSTAASVVAGRNAALFDRVLLTFCARVASLEIDLEQVFRASLLGIAELSAGEPQIFDSLLDALIRLAGSPGAPLEDLLEHALPIARISAGDRADAYRDAIEDLVRLRTVALFGGREKETWYAVGRMRSIVVREPPAWRGLVVPVLQSQGPGAVSALWACVRIERWIDGADSVALLRAIVTQEGVRAPELIDGFLAEALWSGAIGSLGGERDSILGFLRDVSIAHPEYYRRYREIMAEDLPVAEKRNRVEALQVGISALVAAIVRGEVSEEAAADPLFAEALYHVFPPAITASRQQFAHLVRTFADHPEHTAHFEERGALEATRIELATGAYRVRDGETIDQEPWQPSLAAVRSVHASDAPAPELADLGRALLSDWIEGRIGQAEKKVELLSEIYRHHRAARGELPEELGEAATLLLYRELLADSAKEIIQDALRALRIADPERYREQVEAKLSRRARVGKGLVRAVWRTVAAHREGSIDAETAIDRLSRQLTGFDLASEGVRLRLLAVDREDLQPLLESLERSVAKVELGEEHLRVLGDLVGAELAAMHRELFGDAEHRGKLEYRRTEGGRGVPIRFEVTKRRAHAPIGFCEGVCTAPDREMWEDPRFLQVVFWGPNDRALGGMHLLIVEIDGDEHLVLPGINPSLSLLSEVGAEALLDAIFGFARHVAERWKLSSVLVPTHRGIATNRGPIRELLDRRGYRERELPVVQLSHRPYRYSFDRAFVVE